MNLRQYLAILAIGTAVAISAWCVVVMAINPLNSGATGFVAFYLTLYFSLIGLLTILGTVVRSWRTAGEEDDLQEAVARSFRQGLLLSALLVGSLYLMTEGLLSLLTLLIVVASVAIVEFLFLVGSRPKQLTRFEADGG